MSSVAHCISVRPNRPFIPRLDFGGRNDGRVMFVCAVLTDASVYV